MKWLTNMYDPRRGDMATHVMRESHETPDEVVARWLEWLQDNVLGRPQATTAHTVEQLEAMGYVGVYEP